MLSRRGASESGRLRTRVTLQKPTPSADGAGGSTIAFAAVGTLAADIMPIRADERRIGEAIADLTTHKIIIRHRSDIEPDDRFVFGDRVFRIRSVTDPD